MTDIRSASSRLPRAALLLALAGITALYWDAIRTPFLNDDFLFLEQAARRPLATSLTDLGTLGNYYRPLARQIYFEILTPIANGNPLVFHLVNYALFVAALALVADLLAAFLFRSGVLAGTVYFALLPLQRVNLTWVSCSQDLLALVGVLGALALHRRGRMGAAALCFAVGFMSKETALALPLGLVGWDRFVERRPWPGLARRVLPFVMLALSWGAVSLLMRARQPGAPPLDFSPPAFAAGFVHLVQSLLGLEHPPGIGTALLANGPPLVPLVLLAALAFWYPPDARSAAASKGRAGDAGPDRTAAVSAEGPAGDPGPERAAAAAEPLAGGTSPARRALLAFAVTWLLAFAIPAGPVSYSWSSYYYTLAAVGAALIAGFVFARADRWTWLALATGLLWWHAAGSRSPAFAVTEQRWVWTSHLTPFYFQRGAALIDSLSRQLRRTVPHPERHTRFFFATLPSWAGFQMGNGAQIRALYRDSIPSSRTRPPAAGRAGSCSGTDASWFRSMPARAIRGSRWEATCSCSTGRPALATHSCAVSRRAGIAWTSSTGSAGPSF